MHWFSFTANASSLLKSEFDGVWHNTCISQVGLANSDISSGMAGINSQDPYYTLFWVLTGKNDLLHVHFIVSLIHLCQQINKVVLRTRAQILN
jgi:hypothetical protein